MHVATCTLLPSCCHQGLIQFLWTVLISGMIQTTRFCECTSNFVFSDSRRLWLILKKRKNSWKNSWKNFPRRWKYHVKSSKNGNCLDWLQRILMFRAKAFVREGLCSKRYSSFRSVTTVTNLWTFHAISQCLFSILFLYHRWKYSTICGNHHVSLWTAEHLFRFLGLHQIKWFYEIRTRWDETLTVHKFIWCKFIYYI